MTAQHTPGPWIVMEPGTETGPSRAVVCARGGMVEIYDAPMTRETVANAALIARAPDLLAENGRLREALAQVIGARELGHAQGIAQAALAEKE